MDDLLFSRLSSCFIFCGNRSRSDRILRFVLLSFKEQFGGAYYVKLSKALDNLTPSVALRSKKKAGISYKIPFILNPLRSHSFAFRWLRQSANRRGERTVGLRVSRELFDALGYRGEAHRKRESVHQTALLNRGFIRFLR